MSTTSTESQEVYQGRRETVIRSVRKVTESYLKKQFTHMDISFVWPTVPRQSQSNCASHALGHLAIITEKINIMCG
jgi:hypothetical protein